MYEAQEARVKLDTPHSQDIQAESEDITAQGRGSGGGSMFRQTSKMSARLDPRYGLRTVH